MPHFPGADVKKVCFSNDRSVYEGRRRAAPPACFSVKQMGRKTCSEILGL
jgi:hypothetical protein